MQSIVAATAKFSQGEKLTDAELALLPASYVEIYKNGKPEEIYQEIPLTVTELLKPSATVPPAAAKKK